MKQLMCLEHHLTNVVDARARVNVRSASWLGSFKGAGFGIATTKPYADQRSSGAPPG